VSLPSFDVNGDLPIAVHATSLQEALLRFGAGSAQRRAVASRLERIFQVARSSGHLARFVVFGSFVTDKPEPNDVDVFLLMENSFEASHLTGDQQLLFDHTTAQDHFGASVFWLRRLAALRGEQAAVEDWQVKRGGGQRGIVEIISESP
jgi:predicted nucleotidyltransferase